jgi:hypothetical protein
MNAVVKLEQESADAAVHRLFARELHDGYTISGCHRYDGADGQELFRAVRLKHPTLEKVMRPIHRSGLSYRLGRPNRPATGWPLYVPPFPLVETEPVFVVEGEACADALARLGLPAVTSGGCSSAGTSDWTRLLGRQCILWPDNDESGSKYASDVVRQLRALDCDVRLIDKAVVEALPEKGDCVDWLAQHPDATAAAIRGLPTVPAQDEGAHEAPEPLRRPTPPSTPYPIGELGPTLAPACKAIRHVIQAPDAVCGSSLLAAASLATQGLADVHIDGRVIPLSLWCLTVAESGERKTAVDNEVMLPARETERELAKAYAEAIAAYEIELEQWSAMRDAAKRAVGKGKCAGLADELRNIGPPPLPPLQPRLIVGDFTAEGLAKLLANGRPSVGAFTDEAALVFGGHGMTRESVMRTAGTLSKLWDRGELDRIRSGDGAMKLWGRRLALHLLAQPVIAERAMSDDVLAGQGFLARCLLAWPTGTAGTRLYRAESLRDDPAMNHYRARMDELFQRTLPVKEGERNELEPRALRLDPSAHAAWRTVHDSIEQQLAPDKRYAMCKPWASKAAEQCLRIAGVLTLIEDPDAATISAPTIDRAAELALWHLGEAARLAGTAELPTDVRDAEALLNWCHATGRDCLYSTVALNKGPSRIRERSRFMRAIGELEDAGWAEPVDGGMELDGKHRRNVWRVVRAEN